MKKQNANTDIKIKWPFWNRYGFYSLFFMCIGFVSSSAFASTFNYTDPVAGDNSAYSGESFQVWAEYENTGCNDGVEIKVVSGSCSGDHIKHFPAGCGTHGATGNYQMSVNPTQVCHINIRGDASLSGDKYREVYVKIDQDLVWNSFPTTSVEGDVDTLGATAITKNGTNGTGMAISYSASGACSIINGNQVKSSSGGGTCTVTASIAGDANFTAINNISSKSWVVKKTQSITVTQSPPATATINQTFSVAATATSGLAVTITASGSCSINSGGTGNAVVKMNDAGTCSVSFDQSGNSTWAAAPTVTKTSTAAKMNQTISFPQQAAQVYAPSAIFDISPLATADSGAPVTYTSASAGVCTITGAQNNRVQIVAAGNCVIKANQSGNSSYNAAPEESQTIPIAKASQAIVVSQAAPSNIEAGQSFSITASVASGLDVAIHWSGTACTTGNANNNATIATTGQGTCTVTLSQAGNGNYNAANNIVYNVTATKLQQEIVITSPPAAKRYLSDGAFTVAAQSRKSNGTASGLSVAITTTGGCTGAGTDSASITLTDATTLCTIHYNAAGNVTYDAAGEKTSTVEAIRINQSITVSTIAPDKAAKNASFTVAANASSSLPVSISVTGSCTGAGTGSASITMTSADSSCTVHFNQGGDNQYYPAQEVINLVKDGTAPVIVELKPMASKTNATPSYSFNSSEPGNILFDGACSSKTTTVSAGDNSIVFNRLPVGTYSNCTVQVQDLAGNLSNVLALGSFDVVVGVKAYVAPLAKGTGDCSSWANACADIQQAIDDEAADEVWLMKGVYRPSSALQLKVGVTLIGGFAGNESSSAKADPVKNPSIISADVDANDVVDSTNIVQTSGDIQGSNLASLFVANNLGTENEQAQAKLSGLILNGASSHALWVKGSQVVLEKVRFIANKGSQGAALMLEQGSALTINNSYFKANSVSGKGGAIAVDNNSANRLAITASSFDGNSAGTAGGAISFNQGRLTVLNASFAANQATSGSGTGGAIDLGVLQSPSLVMIKYASFVDNSAGATSGKGGAISIASTATAGIVTLANSLVMDNHAKTAGNISDMAKINDAGFNLVGFNGVSDTLSGASAYQFVGTSLTASEADVSKIVDLGLKDNGGFTPSLAIPANSIAVDRIPSVHQDCSAGSSIKTDQRGKTRPDMDNGNCDIGAFEAKGQDYCAKVQGQDKGINLNQNPENGQLCGNGWQFSGGSTDIWLMLMVSLLGAWRLRSLRSRY